jgi:hypothetical protein
MEASFSEFFELYQKGEQNTLPIHRVFYENAN